MRAGRRRHAGRRPPCIDWAALSAIAGDHSCSSQELTATVLESDWILAGGRRRGAAQARPGAHRRALRRPSQMPASKDLIADFQRRMEDRGRPRCSGSMHCALPTTGCSEPIPNMRPAPARTTRTSCCARPRTAHDADGVRRAHAEAGLRNQRDRRLRVVSPQRPAEGHPARQRAARAGGAAGAGARDAVRRSLRAALPRRHLRRRATWPGPGATCRSARARTTSTTRPGSRSSPGRAAASRWC